MKQDGPDKARWRAVERIFDAALELDTGQRAAFVATECGSDAALRAEVESLLQAYFKADDFLAAPVEKAEVSKLAAALRHNSRKGAHGNNGAHADERIGPYRLLRELAQGGMGAVWLAERADDQFHQQVAIKLLKADAASAELLHRFRHERQVLAELNHPNIARLLDGGETADGRPYIVLEYIAGLPLDEYCQRNQLALNKRLLLFRQVCAAVHYAHQHLLIHRDLKPGNILVTEDGTPKLLDFGIAKLLQPSLAQSYSTLTGLQPMTPAYASPEQVRGEKLTTASDVYSLGVLLYELLTGRSPYQLMTNTFGELSKAICEQDPLKPSSAVTQTIRNPQSAIRNLKGDVDSIVLMALRKEAQARYSSVAQFAEDLRRYLAGLPTSARKSTFGYRAVKYMRRHKVPVAAAALVLLSLLGGLGATWRQARLALAAQQRAESALASAEERRQQAEAARTEAHQQRNNAETQRTVAETQRARAEKQKTRADEQRTLADEQRALAEKQKAVADEQRVRAETQELSNRRLLYTSRMGLAMQAWEEANVGRVLDLLNPYLPQAGAPDFRGFEWYYLWKLSHQEERTLPIPGGIQWAVFSPDGAQLLTVVRKHAEASTPVTTEVIFRDLASGQAQRQLSLPAATLTALSRERNILALAQHGRGEISLVALPDGAELRKVTGLQGGLSCLAFTPGGQQLVAGFYDGSLSLIELATGRELYHFKAHQQRVFTVAVAPDGQKFVSGSDDRSARLWALSAGKELFTLGQQLHLPQNSLFSPDGRLALVSGSGRTTAWAVASGKELAQFMHKGRRLAFTPDSRTLVIGGEDAERQTEITFFDTATWQETGVLRGHGGWIMALAVTPDGRQLASGSLDQTVKLWDLQRVSQMNHLYDPRKFGEFTHAVLTPDGRRLLTGNWNQSASVWDLATGKEVALLQGHAPPPNNSWFRLLVAVSADSKWYATGGGVDAQVKIWAAATGKEVNSFKAPPAISALSFSPAGGLLAVGCFNQTQLREPNGGQVLATLTGQQGAINGLGFSADGKSLFTASAAGTVRVWDVATGQTRQEYRCGNSTILAFALARDGRSFATGGGDAARLWEAQTGRQLLEFKGHTSAVCALAFSPDGRRLATGSQERGSNLKLWDTATGEELIALRGHGSWIANNSLGFSPDGGLLFSAHWNRSVKFWRAAREQEVLARRN